jgi:phosphatidylinositol phospholipase C delta
MWNKTLRELHAIRQELMRGLGNGEMRQALWEKHYWTGADDKLTFDQVEKLCRRLNIHSNHEDLFSLFEVFYLSVSCYWFLFLTHRLQQADKQKRGFLDFDDFRHFVKLLKARPEINRLYNKLKATNGGVFDFGVFETFMREKQQV